MEPYPGAKKITELTFSYYRNDFDTDETEIGTEHQLYIQGKEK